MLTSCRKFSTIVFLVLVAPVGNSSELPLFASDEVIDITFEVPMNTLVKEAERLPVVEGVLYYTGDDGQRVTLDLEMNTRGKSRLEYCQFPPLKINLKRKQTKGTLFAGQNKLKLVTRCRTGASFERYLYQEYSIYGAFNVLADRSFRVRMLRATYHDTSGERDDEEQLAYFIETDNEVAARYGMEELSIKQVSPHQLDPSHTSKLSLFQYLIGNTDWSVLKAAPNEDCCHNGKLIIEPGSEDGWIVLPYDFDQAGLINTRYSNPAEALGIRSVRQRVFRGRCSNIGELENTIAIFNERRAEIEAELLPPQLEGRQLKVAAGYIDSFYDIINDPKKLEDRIVEECLGR